MRCNNCGWNNPEGIDRCQKCNQPLSNFSDTEKKDDGISMCPECGYPLYDGITQCPNCGYDSQSGNSALIVQEENTKQGDSDISKTVLMNDLPKKEKPSPQPQLKKVDLRKTMVDESIIDQVEVMSEHLANGNSSSKSVQPLPVENKSNSYTFGCIDGGGEVVIQSSSELSFNKGDIILLAGLRYRY